VPEFDVADAFRTRVAALDGEPPPADDRLALVRVERREQLGIRRDQRVQAHVPARPLPTEDGGVGEQAADQLLDALVGLQLPEDALGRLRHVRGGCAQVPEHLLTSAAEVGEDRAVAEEPAVLPAQLRNPDPVGLRLVQGTQPQPVRGLVLADYGGVTGHRVIS
jgi:hypothetical protein